MKKFIIITLLATIVIGTAVFAGMMFLAAPSEELSPTSPIHSPTGGYTSEVTPVSPGGSVSGGDTGTVSLPTITGNTVTARDFKKDEDVFLDAQNNPGFYALGPIQDADESTPDPAYLVGFQEQDATFLITILREPIAESRLQAETYLASKLDLNQSQMCLLRYMVTVPYWVNDFYSGMNLGFSFCPGATPL